mgnify:CR=1 FL=1
MTTQKEKANQFAELHVEGDPLILFNIWDTGSAKAVQEAGAKAIATGSHSVAAANGYDDGQHMPLDLALGNLERIIANVDLPVTIDFEGGYATEIIELQGNITKVIDAGAVGINFEDQIVGGEGLYSIRDQSERIAAVREAADKKAIPLFINALTDVFLKTYPAVHNDDQLKDVLARAEGYAKAGANGFFAPGLRNADLIRKLCERSPIPVNIMMLPDTPSNKEMAGLGVARISYGPGPYRQMIQGLKDTGRTAFASLA